MSNAEELLNNKLLIIVILLLLSIFTTLPNHLNYSLPLHADEYDNLAIVNETASTGKIAMYDPYAPSSQKSIYHSESILITGELGYEIFLSISKIGASLGVGEMIILLPLLTTFLLLISTFLLTRYLFRSNIAAIISSIFTLFVGTNPSFLGYQFMVASSLGLALMPFLLYLLLKAVSSRKFLLSFFAFFILSSFFYPVTSFIVLLIAFIYLLFNPKVLLANLREIALGLITFTALFFLSSVSIMVSFTYGNFYKGFSQLFQEHGPMLFFALIDYFVDFFIEGTLSTVTDPGRGIPVQNYITIPMAALFLIALISSIYITLKKAKFSEKNSNELLVLPISFFFLSAFTIFLLTQTNFIIPLSETNFMIRRAFLFLFYSAAVMGGFGFWILYEFFSRKFSRQFVSVAAIAIITLSLFYFPFASADDFYHNIELEQLPAIDWINENTPENSLILSTPYLSKPINVLTGRKVVCTNKTKFGCRPEHIINTVNFFLFDCQTQEKMLTEYYQADFIVKPESLQIEDETLIFPDLNCNFLEERFSNELIKIYKVNIEYSPEDLAKPIISGCE